MRQPVVPVRTYRTGLFVQGHTRKSQNFRGKLAVGSTFPHQASGPERLAAYLPPPRGVRLSSTSPALSLGPLSTYPS